VCQSTDCTEQNSVSPLAEIRCCAYSTRIFNSLRWLQLHRVPCTGSVTLGVVQQLPEWWEHGLEPRWGHACPSVVSVVCCVGSGLCDELINRLEWFSGHACNYVWSRNVNHEASLARFGVLRHRKIYRHFKPNKNISQRHLIALTDKY